MMSNADVQVFQKLSRYDLWANRRAAEMLAALPESALAQPLLLLSHLLRAERVWLGRLSGTPDAGVALWETDPLDSCRRSLETSGAALEKYVSSLSATALENQLSYTNSQGTPFQTQLSDVLTHLFNHSTHHRAQLAALVRAAGQVPLPLDYIVYVREQGR